ncbi:MAG: hypothetical protein K0R10_436 [Alphaproteobacteria bacterium]|jgi:hypothetical protein|nr:hypothetical protein [Alphaproteobacteria bacterium]
MRTFINFINSHVSFLSIVIVSTIGLNGVFVSKENNWSHWSWLIQFTLLVLYLLIEYSRHIQENLSAKDRFKKYLLDFEGWEKTDENDWHYKQDPDFRVCPTEDKIWEVEGGENWVRAAINPRAFVRPMQLQYKQTIIAKIVCICFDEMRYMVSAPKVTGMIGHGEKWYYSLCADDLDFYLLPLLTNRAISDIIMTGEFNSRLGKIPVAVFASEQEKSRFEVYLTQRPIEEDEIKKFPARPLEKYIKEVDLQIIAYSKAVLERLEEYRKLNH